MSSGLPTVAPEPDALEVVAGELPDPLEDAHQVSATISPRKGVNFIDNNEPQIREKLDSVDSL